MKVVTRLVSILAFAIATNQVVAGANYLENFDDNGPVDPGQWGPRNLISKGWEFRNQSSPVGSKGWYDGTFFTPQAGTGYLAADSLATGFFGGRISLWAILPVVSGQQAGDLLEIWARRASSSNLDTLEIRYSPSGGTSTGSGADAVGDFTDLLVGINPIPTEGWTRYTASVPGPGRIALRYFVSSACNFGCFSSSIGVDTLSIGPPPPPPCNLPPTPAPGETVVWTAAGSPYEICSDIVIPEGGEVVIEPGVTVNVFSGHTMTVAGTMRGSGTPTSRIVIAAPGAFPPALVVTGLLDLDYADISGQLRPDSGGSVLLDHCAFAPPGILFAPDGSGNVDYRPPFVEVSNSTFEAAALDANSCTLAARHVTIRNSYLRSTNGYVLLDDVTIENSGSDAIILNKDHQPVYLDHLTVTGAAGAALSLSGGNAGNDFLIGPTTLLSGNQLPVRLGDGGLLPGSALPASGNANNYILWDTDLELDVRGPVTFAPFAIPYVVGGGSGIATVSGDLSVLPGAVIELGPGVVIEVKGRLRAHGKPGQPITFKRFDPSQAWNFIAFQNEGNRLEHAIVEGGSNGISAAGQVLHMNSCVLRNNHLAAQVSGLGTFKIRGSRFENNAVAAVTDPSPISSGGLDFNGATNPNSFTGNGVAIQARTDQPVDARQNWWGDPTGPNAPDNPGGQGDPVTGGVRTVPFRTSPPDATNAPPVVRLKRPFFLQEPGSRTILSWEAEDNDDGIAFQRILFSPAGNLNFTTVVADGLGPGVRSYEWTVPDIGFQSSNQDAYVRIVAVDAAGQEGWDEAGLLIPSGDMSGTAKVTTDLTGPFTMGEHSELCYEAHDLDEFFTGVDAFLFLDGDDRVVPLGGLSAASGCLPIGFDMPYASTDTARIGLRINGTCCNRVRWSFDSYFTVRPDGRLGDGAPAVALTSPAAGDSYEAGAVVPIRWTASDDEAVRSFDVQASFDSGRTWQPIASDLPGSSSGFDWRTPQGQGFTDLRVRVVVKDLRFQNSSAGQDVSFSLLPTCFDADGDGFGSPGSPACPGGAQPDCDDGNGSVWAVPGEARDLLLAPDKETVSWSPPAAPGGTASSLRYDVLRSAVASDFGGGAACVESDGGPDTAAVDPAVPPVGEAFFYLVRAENLCGAGSLGRDSAGTERAGRACP
jgi:hypothetical protein